MAMSVNLSLNSLVATSPAAASSSSAAPSSSSQRESNTTEDGPQEQPTEEQTEPPTEEQPPPPLTASITIDSTDGDTAPATFLFEAEAEGGTEPYTYSWNFGDGSPQSNEQNIEHTFVNPGTYVVTLTVSDSTGQTVSDRREVNVQPAGAATTTEPAPSIIENITSVEGQNNTSGAFGSLANETTRLTSGPCPPGYVTLSPGSYPHGEPYTTNCISEAECRLISQESGGVCGDRCVLDFNSDRDNCDGCNIHCAGTCSQGQCVDCTSSQECPGVRVCLPGGVCRPCRQDQAVYNGECVNLVCNNPNQIRINHQCQTCPEGTEPFLNRNVFPASEECRTKCAFLRHPFTGVCRDPPITCPSPCATERGFSCIDGSCQCPPGWRLIRDWCRPPSICGPCGNTSHCPPGTACANSKCYPTYPENVAGALQCNAPPAPPTSLPRDSCYDPVPGGGGGGGRCYYPGGGNCGAGDCP